MTILGVAELGLPLFPSRFGKKHFVVRWSFATILCLLCGTMSHIHEVRGEPLSETPAFCLKTNKDELCTGRDCTRPVKQPCYHGTCSDTGDCVCSACWDGPSCNVTGNKHAPVFIQKFYEEYISPDENTEFPFVYIRATDEDKAACGASTAHCPCAEVLYSLDDDEKGAKSSPFVIDSKTGGISVATGAKLTPNTKHRLTANARNGADRLRQATVHVIVIVTDVYLRDSEQSVKLRKLQAVSPLDANHTLDISFLPTAEDIGVGTLSVGSRVNCELIIDIPESAVVEDIQVEIFTEDENNTLSVICPPTVTPGSEIEITDSTEPETSYHQEGNPFLIDTAVFNFGNVSNTNTSFETTASKIVITFSITLMEGITLENDDRYWVSAGVEYSGDTKLWIGQIGFLVEQQPQYSPDTNVTIDGGPIDYHKGEVEVFNVDLNVYRSVANLTVQATAGSTVQSDLLICELQLCSTGSGYCLDVTKDLATFQVDVASQNAYESTFGFGNIVNGGVANSTTDSRISMDVVTFLREDSSVAVDTSHDLDVTIDDGTKQTGNTASFTVKAARNTITPTRDLTMNVSAVDGGDQIYPGESVKIRVAIAVPSATSVRPVTVSLESKTSGEEFQICAARINYIGSDISCLEQRRDAIESAVVKAAGPILTIDLGGVGNTGGESTANGVHNVIGVDFVVKSTVTDLGQNNAAHTLDATVNYAGLTPPVLTDTVDVTTITDPDSISYPTVPDDDVNPVSSTFDLLDPTGTAEVAPGEYVLLAVRPVIQPDTQYRYIASALVNSTDITIVDVRVTFVGSNMACGLFGDPAATYTLSDGGTTNEMAEIDLGRVYNTARFGTTTSKDDSLEIQLVVQVTGEAVDSDLGVAVALLVGATRLWVAEGNITAKTSIAMDPVLPTNNTLAAAPGFSTEVTAGSESKLLHTLIIPVNSSLKHVVNYTTAVPWLQITQVNVTSVGEQLLCTSEGVRTPTYCISASGMCALLDLDYVCNVPVGNGTDEESKLVVELTVLCLNSTDLEVGSTGVVAAALEVSNAMESKLYESRELIFSVELPKAYKSMRSSLMSTFKLCCPESAYFMRPGETERCNITMTILDRALTYHLEINTPFNDTAAMAITNVEVDAGGYNLQFDAPDVVLESSGNTSQNDQALLDFGQIINTESHTEEAGNLEEGDNDVVIHIDVQMSDGDQNTNGSYQALEAGVGVGGGVVIWVSYFKLAVLRDGSERPTLNVSFNHNSTVSTYSVGDKVWYQVDVTHATDSNAEAVNVKGHIFLPPYIQFDSMVPNYDLSGKQPDITQSSDNTGFYFTVPRMFFSDRIAFSLESTIKTDYRYKLTKNWKGTTPIEVLYYMSHYDTSHYTDSQYFSEPMDYVTYDFTVPYPEIPGPNLPPTCGSPQALGMESGTIPDCQITASFSPDPSAAAHHARLRGSSAWKTPARAGPFLYDRWLKVDLGKKTALTGVRTQGGPAGVDGDLGEFEILYSLDDTLYKAATPSDNKPFDHQKDSPASHDDVVTHTLLIPVETRYVLLNLTAYNYIGASKWYNALRLELLGCPIETETASDVCPTTDTPLPEAYERGFLVDPDTDTLFICDTVTHGQSGVRRELQASVYAFQWKKPDMQCFKMIYTEKQWTGLDSRLRNIIGFLPSSGRLYGIMSNSPDSYAASDAPYHTWYLIPQSEYTAAAGSEGFISSVSVPFVSDPATGFTYDTPDDYTRSGYAIDAWKATMSGIFRYSEKVLDWNQCCQPTCAANGGPENCS